ncbi:MAG: electron transfer flavoprotein subunit alpha/FixB family protein [Conexivisphaera sp.]
MSLAQKRKSKRVDCSTVCPEWECRQPGEHEGIWVVGEMEGRSVSEPSLQMLTPARAVAHKLGTFVEGVLLGADEGALRDAASEMIKRGADRATLIVGEELSEPVPPVYASAVAALARERKPDVILLSATMRGREIAPYVASLLRAGITADCTQFDVDEDSGDLFMIRPPFAAILLAYIKTPTRRPQIATARPNVFPMPPRDDAREGTIEVRKASVYAMRDPRMRLVRSEVLRKDDVPLEKAEYVVAGGKGVGTREGFAALEELARVLGGVVAGSRRAVDLGLVPHERQVGQTGKSVRPKLYVAVGISGAAQHVMGIREAGIVVAINIDRDAPIFRNADYGIVADWREVVPALIREIERRRGQDGAGSGAAVSQDGHRGTGT